jgi:hypothetical protein
MLKKSLFLLCAFATTYIQAEELFAHKTDVEQVDPQNLDEDDLYGPENTDAHGRKFLPEEHSYENYQLLQHLGQRFY